MTEKDKKESSSQAPSSAESKPEPDEAEKDDSKKKPWQLAPRTGQRHANPFQRKSK